MTTITKAKHLATCSVAVPLRFVHSVFVEVLFCELFRGIPILLCAFGGLCLVI